jgi:glucosamine--fructose-6-phosphate aminotransferase (isomerizing)
MSAEVAEQPAVWRGLLGEAASASSDLASAAELIRRYAPRFVLFVARGTSDHAALYGKYLAEISLELPCGLVSPSTMTAYGARPDLSGVLLIGVSQSGGSPDLVQSVEVARARGALTVAVTNQPGSPLARAAEASVDIRAGVERAVAATKSYTAQLLALYLVLDRVGGGHGAEAAGLPDLGDELLGEEERIAGLAYRYRFASRLVATARGYSYPTVREAALKLMETSYISAQAFSGADLLHGPLAMIESSVPVLTVVAEGIGGQAMGPVLPRLAEQGADVFCVGTSAAVAAADAGVVLPSGAPEKLSPLLEILPFQQLARYVAISRGSDPDAPRGLRKVTETY